MTPEMVALGRRAVACKAWRLMGGMLMVRVEDGRKYRVATVIVTSDDYVPDLTDPATLGCLLALVREAWGDPHASVWYDSEYWQNGNRWSWHAKEKSLVDYDTEVEALVAALEDAP